MKFVIVASGPSAHDFDPSWIPRQWRCITVNCAWKLHPDAEHHYAGDYAWWESYHRECKSTGKRWSWDTRSKERFGINQVIRKEGRGLCIRDGYIHHGGNSGYQAINLAYHLGARRIVLYGFDFSRKNGSHFHGDHPQGLVNAPQNHIDGWKRHMDYMARDLVRVGVKCMNASAYTELECFDRLHFAEAVK